MLDQDALDWIAAELACEVNRINCAQMSITHFREALSHIPGGSSMTMRYGNGGRTEIYKIGEDEIEIGAGATAAEVEAAFELKKKEHSATR